MGLFFWKIQNKKMTPSLRGQFPIFLSKFGQVPSNGEGKDSRKLEVQVLQPPLRRVRIVTRHESSPLWSYYGAEGNVVDDPPCFRVLSRELLETKWFSNCIPVL